MITSLIFLATFVSINPSGYTYRDRVNMGQCTYSNVGYYLDDIVRVDNRISYLGYLDYNSVDDYVINSDNITYQSVLYYDNGATWSYLGSINLVMSLSHIDNTISYLSNMRFVSYFSDNYFILRCQTYYNNEWQDIDSTDIELSYPFENEDEIITTIDMSYFGVQVDNRLKGTLGYDIQGTYQQGYNTGYTEGYNEGFSSDSTAITIFNGILNIALVPINFFLGIFNFEILGINIASFVSAILSVCLVIIVIRFITGKKQGD